MRSDVLEFGLSKEIACVALIGYDGREINPTILVRSWPHENSNKTVIVTGTLKPELVHGRIAKGCHHYLDGKACSLRTTPSGPILVVWMWSDGKPLPEEDERGFQEEFDRVAKAMRGLAGLASAA
ncbi:MAG: hypothetical protein AMXMBFR44_3440 [Candidatus Campbellbacteria bacterium]